MTEFLLKATVAMSLALIMVAGARRARAAVRHGILAAMFVALLILPFAPSLLPRVEVPAPHWTQSVAASWEGVMSVPLAGGRPEIAPAPARSLDVLAWAKTIYVSVAGLLLLSLMSGLWRLQHWSRRGEVWVEGIRRASAIAAKSGIRRAVMVVVSKEVTAPMTFGFRKQTILLPAEAMQWDGSELDRALRHELEHVSRDDWGMQLIARLVTALYWPHPLVWLALRRFCIEAERACDDAVVRSFEASGYASQLLTLARSMSGRKIVPALAMASPTRLSERVRAILDPQQKRGPQGWLTSTLVIAVTITLISMFGSVSLVGAARSVDERLDRQSDDDFAPVMIKAAESGDVALLGRLLNEGIDVNRSYDGDGTALLIAAKRGHIDAVRYLIARGADVNATSPGDGNPLIAAAQYGRLEIVQLLLDRGARIDEIVPGDENALMGASEMGHLEVVRLLLSRGADVNLGTWVEGDNGREFRTPLQRARHGGHREVQQLLLAAGARR